MNEAVANVLKARLENLDWKIKDLRDHLSGLTVSTTRTGSELDRLTTERRAIQDALDVNA